MLKAGICFGTGSFAGLVSAWLCVMFSEQKLCNYREVPLCPHIPAVNIHLLIFLWKIDFFLQKKLHILKKTKSCKFFISRIGKKYFLPSIPQFSSSILIVWLFFPYSIVYEDFQGDGKSQTQNLDYGKLSSTVCDQSKLGSCLATSDVLHSFTNKLRIY